MRTISLRLSSPAVEGVLRASKWLKHQVLLDTEEMGDLFTSLSPFQIFSVSEVVGAENGEIDLSSFLSKYDEYVSALKEGKQPDDKAMKRYFSSVFTCSTETLYGMQVGEGKFLVKPLQPVIQLQAHFFFVSSVDRKFHPMVLSGESVSWGIQFSYPQLAQHPKTQRFSKVDSSPEFPNTPLYTKLSKWLRANTAPTPFIYEGEKTVVPIRLGKKCSSWISKHPQLIARGIAYAR